MALNSFTHRLASIENYEQFEQHKGEMDLWGFVIQHILDRHHLPKAPLQQFEDGCNLIFVHGNNRVLKIFPPCHQDQFQSELLLLKKLAGQLSVRTPRVEFHGEMFNWPYIIMDLLEGVNLEGLWETLPPGNQLIIIKELGQLIREVHALSTDGLEAIDSHWPLFIKQQIDQCIIQHQVTQLPKPLIDEIPAYLAPLKTTLPMIQRTVILTGEYTPMNFLVKQIDGVWHINALIDFGDAMLGAAEYDLLGPGAFLIHGNKDLLKAFLLAYGYLPEQLNQQLSHHLTALMLLHKHSHLKIQIRINDWQSKVNHLSDLENLVWGF